jgi:hypothetical protein
MSKEPPVPAKDKLRIKKELLRVCELIVEDRIITSSLAMQHAQESANSDDKSSAGDKYETGRAMGQRESDMHSVQLKQNQQDLVFLQSINTTVIHQYSGLGAILKCKDFLLFISLGLGSATHESQKVFFLSPYAPLALALKGKCAHDHFIMGGKEIEILDIF